MHGRCRTGEVIDPVHFQQERLHDIMTEQFKIPIRKKSVDVLPPAGEKVVQADDLVTFPEQSFAQVRPQEPRAAGNQYPHLHSPACFPSLGIITSLSYK
jgi:hypothetical protein